MCQEELSEKLYKEYNKTNYLYQQLCIELKSQLQEVINETGVKLAFPIEYRIKEWDSINNKLKSHPNVTSLSDFVDIAGLRIITLFSKDVDKVTEELRSNFDILNEENTTKRLKENEFGYVSIHLDIMLKESWKDVPTMKNLIGLKAEIQVRTAAQHIWAMASHDLQYKKEESIPHELLRSVNRASALLELIDEEFGRILNQRNSYVEERTENIFQYGDEIINVNNLEVLLDKILPKENKAQEENYAALVEDLIDLNVTNIGYLKQIIEEHLNSVIKYDKMTAMHSKSNTFFRHVGLVRKALEKEFKIRFENGKIVQE